jgi:hypothetical protein
MLEIRYYVAASGEGPFAEWFAELDPAASAKIVRAARPHRARQSLQM